jgi:hypothetical protein
VSDGDRAVMKRKANLLRPTKSDRIYRKYRSCVIFRRELIDNAVEFRHIENGVGTSISNSSDLPKTVVLAVVARSLFTPLQSAKARATQQRFNGYRLR